MFYDKHHETIFHLMDRIATFNTNNMETLIFDFVSMVIVFRSLFPPQGVR